MSALLVMSMLCGCSTKDNTLVQALALRKELLSASKCSFQTEITADYGDIIHTFQADCVVDETGNLVFTVTLPESIAGISGRITQEDASLIFGDKAIAFPMLADGQISPVCSPWLFIKALRGGYFSGCGKENTGFCLYIDDSFQDHPLRFEVYTDLDMVPASVDLFWINSRILSLKIQNFVIQ